jgi:hypothetical protein
MHDARSMTLTDAILRHQWEAQPVIDPTRRSATRKRGLLAFLNPL